jgi:hypothetical protein
MPTSAALEAVERSGVVMCAPHTSKRFSQGPIFSLKNGDIVHPREVQEASGVFFRVQLFFQFGGPVQEDGKGRGIGFVDFGENQEFLTVGSDIVGEEVLGRDGRTAVRLKQCNG